MSSLLSNFDIAQQALQTSLNSSGSAMREHDRWSQSLEAKLNKLKATWQSLSQSFMSSNFLKVALDGVIALVDGIDSLISTFGTIPTLLTAFATFKSFTGDGIFKTVIDEADSTSKKMTNIFSEAARQSKIALENIGLKRDSDFKSTLEADIDALNNWYDELAKGPPREDAFSNIFKNASEEARKYAESGKIATEGLNGFIKSQQKAQVSTLAQNKSLANARTIIKEYFTGCQNVGLSQKDFADAVSKTNPKLAEQLNSAKSAKGALTGYAISLVGATAKTIALEAATALLNATISMGISFLISVGISAITKWINKEKDLAEEVQKLTSEYKEQHDALKKISGDYDTSNEKSMISRYEKLSKGVSAFGDNISLTADEYSEYQGIVNKIAEQIPKLVSGYDSQGNAILSCAGNVETLRTEYEKLIEAQNREIITNAGKIEEDFENKRQEANSNRDGFFGTKISYDRAKDYRKILDDAKNGIIDTDTALDNLFNKLDGIDDDGVLNSAENADYSMDIDALSDALENADFERKGSWFNKESQEEHIKRAFREDKETVSKVLEEYYADIEAEVEQSKSIAQAILSDAFDISTSGYYGLSDTLKNIAEQTVSNLDFDFFDKLKEDGTSVKDWTKEMLDGLNSISKTDNKEIESAFNLKTKFNNGDISYGEYVDGIENAGKLIDDLGLKSEVKSQLKLSLGLDEKGFVEQYDNLLSRLTGLNREGKKVDIENALGFSKQDAEKFLDSLSSDELSVFAQIVPEIDAGSTVEQIKRAISREMAVQGLTFDLNFEVETAGIDALNTAMAESVSATGLSSDSIKALKGRYAELEAQGYDLSAMFEETSNGIHLNRKALGELEKEYAKQKQADIEEDLSALKKEYDLLTKDIDECTDASERASLYTQRDAILQQINDAATLAAQYEGLTSAYNDWQRAESSGSERDMYENIISGFETVENEISRGWYDDGTIEFLELLTGKDLSTANIDEIKKAWKSVDETIKGTDYSIRDFFTTNEDGESTNTGVYNFLRAVEDVTGDKDVIKRDENNKIIGFDFQVFGGDEAIAEALGVSEELVQIMLRAADDAGFVVTLDGQYTQLADLKKSAEEANDVLKKLGKTDYDFNFDANNLEDLNGELAKADEVLDKFRNKDGTINMEMEGAEEALEIASYFTATIDKLTEPVYMQLETNQVEKELQDPLKKMQEFERLSKQKHQLQLTGDTEEIEKVEKEMDEIANYLDNLDEETKIKLGIEGLTTEEIKSKLEKGEIEIPATVDIQLEMSDDIKDMRLLMMNQIGLVSDEEIKLKIGYEIEDSLVDKLTDEEKKVVVKYIEENPEAWDKLSDEEQQVVVDLVADESALEALKNHQVEIEAFARIFGVEKVDDLKKKLDSLTDEEITILTKVLGQIDVEKLKTTVAGLDDKTVQAIAEAIGKGDVEGLKTIIGGLDDKTVQAIAEAFGYSDVDELNNAIDNLDPKVVQAIAQALGITDVNSLREAINRLTGKDVDAVAHVDGKDDVDGLKNAIDNLKGKSITIWAKIEKKASDLWDKLTGGGGGVDGTAHVNGTAFSGGTVVKSGKAYKQGNWGAKDSGVALMGEEAPELLVRNGRWHLVGEKGAGFYGYKKGDIIFNAEQTKQIFEKGKITHGNGRGKSLATGTAFSSGTGGDTEIVVGKNPVTGEVYTKSSSSSDSKDKEESQEVLDWIETKLSRIQRAIDKLDQKANNIYKKWSTRNKTLAQEIDKVRDEIELQQKAYDKYMAAAEGVGLSSSYASKVRNGEIDIETITDETLKEKISDYQNYYEKALACKDAIEELKITESELYKQRFDNVASEYDGILGVIEHEKNMLEEYISQSEAQAWLVSSQYYKALANNERDNITQLKKEQASLLSAFEDAKNSGAVEKNSEGWYEYVNAIDEVTLAIEQSNTQLLEYQQTIQQLKFEQFDLLQDKISSITEETEFLIELMSNKKLYDDNGQLTEEGKSTMGLHGVAYNVNMSQADKYGQEAARLKRELAKDPYDTELEERYREMISLQQEHIIAAEQEKNAIRDMVEEGIELEIDALQELIDKKNEELDSAKDLYEYNKQVKEQAQEIATLEKEIAGYRGDNSEESRRKIQELELSLSDAKTNLEETEQDRVLENTQKMLDSLVLEYETVLNMRLDNIDYLISQMITEINSDAGIIGDTIRESTENVGYTLSESMQTIWNASESNITSSLTSSGDKINGSITSSGDKIANVVTTYGDKFSTAQTTTNAALTNITTGLNNVVAQLNKKAETNTKKASTSSVAKPNTTTTSKPATTKPTTTTNKNTSSGGDGKPKVGDKVKFVSGQYYYDSQGKNPLGYHNRGKEVYITSINNKDWATHPYHISTGSRIGNGDLGWLKLEQLSGYATGKKNFLSDEVAWTQEKGREMIVRPSDGAILTPVAKGDSVLNATASGNIWNMANNPAEFIKNNLNLGSSGVPNNSNSQNSYSQTIENVTFRMDNIKNYDEMLNALKTDRNFQKLIDAMTVNRMTGGSSLAKNKSIR